MAGAVLVLGAVQDGGHRMGAAARDFAASQITSPAGITAHRRRPAAEILNRMAIHHLSLRIASHGKGQGAVGGAARRVGERFYNRGRGWRVHPDCDGNHPTFSAILLPFDAPAWMSNREELWSAVEPAEQCVNSHLAREVELALGPYGADRSSRHARSGGGGAVQLGKVANAMRRRGLVHARLQRFGAGQGGKPAAGRT